MGDKIISHSRPTLGKEEEEAAIDVIRSGQLVQGIKVLEFENLIAGYIGKKFAVAVSSGLAALHLSLIALGIKEDDEVILPSYTCDALLQAVEYLKAKPIIVDVNVSDGNISSTETQKAVSERTKAIVIPHSFGFPADLSAFLKFGIPVIEDCAVGLGAAFNGRKLGSFGKISVFSFYATKMISTGEGGMILTDDKNIADEVRELRDYTKHETFKVRYNYKMTDLEAAFGICQLKKLDKFIEMREVLFYRYIELLKNVKGISLPRTKYEIGTKPSFYRFIIKLEQNNSDSVIKGMKEKNILCGKGVLQPLHRHLKLDPLDFPNCENLYKGTISLPLYPSLTLEDIEYIAKTLIEVLGSLKS